MIPRYVFDSGALIGAEKGKQRPLDYVALVHLGRAEIVTPMVCILEWWRGRTDRRETLLHAMIVQPLPLSVAQAAGIALARIRQRVDSRMSIDAAVMAFAAFIDAPVITSDLEDLGRFKNSFPGVRLLSAG